MRYLCAIAFAICIGCVAGQTQPTQIHISVTGDPTEMVISWITKSQTATTTIQYGLAPESLVFTARGDSSQYIFPDPLPMYVSGHIHVATATNLTAATEYYYRVGDESGGWSTTYSFWTENPDASPLKILAVGDIGFRGNNSKLVVDAITQFDAVNAYDLLIHPGDLSYANGNQTIWDEWGTLIEPLASHLPYMVAVGNHEVIDLFIPFQRRFFMPSMQSQSSVGNLRYSFNYASVHFIALDSETYEYLHISAQYEWLKKDLAMVNRDVTPWIVVYFHSPWYTSNTVHETSGLPMRDSFEELFMQYEVDIVVNGHVHAYERTHPVFRDQVNPAGPTYVTVGTGGNQEGLYHSWVEPQPAWSAYRESNYGFGTLDVFNATHAYWRFIRAVNGTIGDEYWIMHND